MAVSAEDIIINIGNAMGPIAYMLNGAAYVIGVAIIMGAILRLKKIADQRNMMSQSTEFMPSIAGFVMGAALIWLPTFFEAATVTVFGSSSSILSHTESVGANYFDEAVWYALMKVMGVIGLIAFIRGILIINKAADGHGASQGGGLGKGLTHLVGGVLCYHIEGFFTVLKDTLGVTSIF